MWAGGSDMFFSSIMRPLIFSLDAEKAHDMAIRLLSHSMVVTKARCEAATQHVLKNKKLSLTLSNLRFSNPLGLAAGFDKNALALRGIAQLGFAFIEVGTITPLPQLGNEKPRLFRLVESEAIINRMGFNNEGLDAILPRLQAYQQQSDKNVLGVNIGVNKECTDREASYVASLIKLYEVADYFTINISSPNTPNLRELQGAEILPNLLSAISVARKEKQLKTNRYVPVFLKIAPDLTSSMLETMAQTIAASDLDGVIISNTTIGRTGVGRHKFATQAGGLSGKPLFEKANITLAKMRQYLGKDKIIIGVGGVDDSTSFIEKLKAGADLVQLYTGLVYKGPSLPFDILSQALVQLEQDGLKHISQYRDLHVDKWAALEL